jgi:dGTPase
VARTIGRALALNEDLVEALALVHDLGHPPFGHAGEDVLQECLRDEGGFSHNAQALRIVRELETRYHDFPGLNLSREVLAGQTARAKRADTPPWPLLEAQVVDAADSIAYDTHDADDALELGLVSLDELLATPLWAEAARRVRARAAGLAEIEMRRAVLHELIDWQVGDLLTTARRRLADAAFDSPHAARQVPPLVVATGALADQKRELEAFLRSRVYRHPEVLKHRIRAQAAVQTMFDGYVARPDFLPEGFRRRAETVGLRRTVGDYLAGMTDRYAWREFERLFVAGSRGTGSADRRNLE